MYKNDPCDVQKFIDAQDSIYSDDITMYQQAYKEISNGKKYSHWIWYIFPQLEGLGDSSYCKRYGIAGKIGGLEYLRNEVLHNRLIQISNALLNLDVSDLRYVMSNIDAMKIRSCITLFYIASIDEFGIDSEEVKLFWGLKDKFFERIGFCDSTLKILFENGEVDDYIL